MDDAGFLLATSWPPDRNAFFEALGIRPGALGGQLFDNVFDCFFLYSIDLKRDYLRYYSVEYRTLRDFVETRYGDVTDHELEKDRLFLIKSFPQVVDPNYSGNKLSIVLQCIENLEAAREIKT